MGIKIWGFYYNIYIGSNLINKYIHNFKFIMHRYMLHFIIKVNFKFLKKK
jgi:hypothetical protein